MTNPEQGGGAEFERSAAIEHNLDKLDKEVERITGPRKNYDHGQYIYGVVDNENGKIAELFDEYDDTRANFVLTARLQQKPTKFIKGGTLPVLRLVHVTGSYPTAAQFDDVPLHELSDYARGCLEESIEIWNNTQELSEGI